MRFLKVAALLALAAIPLLLMHKGKEEPAREVDSDNIFDQELSAD